MERDREESKKRSFVPSYSSLCSDAGNDPRRGKNWTMVGMTIRHCCSTLVFSRAFKKRRKVSH
jgi:hypothetical protein